MTEQNISLTPEAQALLKDMGAAPAALPARVAKAMDRQNLATVSHIQKTYLSFPRTGPTVEIGLRVQTNRLRQSAFATPATVTGSAQVESAIGDSVKYAAIHEFGGTIHHEPRKRELRFKTVEDKGRKAKFRKGKIVEHEIIGSRRLMKQGKNGKLWVFAKIGDKNAETVTVEARAYDQVMPERMPFRRGIKDRLNQYGEAISKAVIATLKGAINE